MGRNKLVYALSRVTLVVASDREKGGTWEGANEALARGYGHVATWMGEGAGPGNEVLVRIGATPIDDVGEILALNEHTAEQVGGSEQLKLGM
jgi:predicted Rossmann fold nucleotide-binding protein DprA/Smf involved in DNA uptake